MSTDISKLRSHIPGNRALRQKQICLDELHITQEVAWRIWTDAKFHARAALALVDGPTTKGDEANG